MKYIKNSIIRKPHEIVVVKDGDTIVNPSHELLLADGWKEYTPTPYIPTLDDIRQAKIDEILSYDASPSVNSFTYGGKELWLDKATRVGLALRFEAEANANRESTTLWLDGECYDMTIAEANTMLSAIELYASACYDATQQHIANVANLTTEEAINGYDYTQGYPNKLTFC